MTRKPLSPARIMPLILFLGFAFSNRFAAAGISETFPFGNSSEAHYVYSDGLTWDFTISRTMLVGSVDIVSVLATEYSGTFHIQLEVNGRRVVRYDTPVSDEYYQPYTYSNRHLFSVAAGDALTYRIWGSFYSSQWSSNLGAIQGPNSVTLHGVAGMDIEPKGFRDDALRVADRFEAPGDAPRGLGFDGVDLWHIDGGDAAGIHRIDRDGQIIASFDAPNRDIHDIAFDGADLWTADYFDNVIYRMDRSGEVLEAIDAPFDYPSGIAFDGNHVWMTSSNARPDRIYKLDRAGRILEDFPCPGGGFKDLAFDGDHLWLCLAGGQIFKLDRQGGILAEFFPPGMSPRGIAFDGEHLWHTDSMADAIFKLSVPRPVSTGSTIQRSFTVANTGEESLRIDELQIDGPDRCDFVILNDGLTGGPLAPGETGGFDIVFAPRTAGVKTADLHIRFRLQMNEDIVMPFRWTAVGEPVPGLPGDMNRDEKVGLMDAVAALQVLCGMGPPCVDTGGDVDGDGRIGMPEAVYVLENLSE